MSAKCPLCLLCQQCAVSNASAVPSLDWSPHSTSTGQCLYMPVVKTQGYVTGSQQNKTGTMDIAHLITQQAHYRQSRHTGTIMLITLLPKWLLLCSHHMRTVRRSRESFGGSKRGQAVPSSWFKGQTGTVPYRQTKHNALQPCMSQDGHSRQSRQSTVSGLHLWLALATSVVLQPGEVVSLICRLAHG